MPKLVKSTGLFLATYRLHEQERDRVNCVRATGPAIDAAGLREIVRALAAFNSVPDSEINISRVERLHEVIELVSDEGEADETENGSETRPTGSKAPAKNRK